VTAKENFMSRKLVTTIQDIKGIPGKHKRVLLAWAAFANNDGTNIFPGKEKVAQKAGICRESVYRDKGADTTAENEASRRWV
jgi:hypothetical protein